MVIIPLFILSVNVSLSFSSASDKKSSAVQFQKEDEKTALRSFEDWEKT